LLVTVNNRLKFEIVVPPYILYNSYSKNTPRPIIPIEVQPLNADKRAITDLSSAVHSSRNSTRRTSASRLKRFTFTVSFAIVLFIYLNNYIR